MKTVKYYIQFDMCDTEMSTPIEITKATYTQQVKFLEEQVLATADYETPMDPARTTTRQCGNVIETTTYYTLGCATTTLIKQECLPGYHFKPKK